MQKKWFIDYANDKQLTSDLDPIVNEILYKRGIREKKEIEKYLYGSLEDLYDPFLLKDMKKAVERIETAYNNNEKIIIYGDYDVDGITSSTLLYSFFKDFLGLEVDYYLPNRLKEGYGLNKDAIKKIIEQNYDLVITVDCGITALEEIKYADENNLDIIVTDHHQPGEKLPPALAIIDPHNQKEDYPFTGLAGVGVAFKLCQGINIELLNDNSFTKLYKYLDVVALGTIADIVTLRDENRILVREGIKVMSKSERIGLKALLDRLKIAGTDLTVGRIGYIIAPPLNAAGRMKDPKLGIDLLTTESKERAVELADKLVKINKERQQEEEKIQNEALKMVEQNVDLENDRCIVLASSEWHSGVIGIVASRLVDKFYLPTILIAIEDGIGKGSCRSISEVNIFKALQECGDNLENYGGHAQAAGLSVKEGNINQFREDLNNYFRQILTSDDLIPQLNLDTVVDLDDINFKLYKQLEMLAPFGMGNPRPKLLLNDVKVDKCYCVGKKNQHLKFSLENGLEGIGFSFGEIEKSIKKCQANIAFHLTLNKWKGRENLQLVVDDINIRSATDYYPVHFIGDRLLIADKRKCQSPITYMKSLISNDKIATFIHHYNSRDFQPLGDDVYDQTKIDKFTKASKGILIFNDTLLSQKIDLNVGKLVFVSLPLSLEEMVDIIKKINPEEIHLLFGEEEYYLKQNMIKNKYPTRKFLRNFYSKLVSLSKTDIPLSYLYENRANELENFNENLINSALKIFEELNLLRIKEEKIIIFPVPENKLDLSESIRYNETTDIIDKFNSLTNLVFNNNLFKLVEKLKIN